MISPEWIQVLAPLGGALGAIGTVYAGIATSKLNAAKQEFDKDKERREALVADVTRCETRMDELSEQVNRWMSKYDTLHTEHLEECKRHAETQRQLAECQRELERAQKELATSTRDREKLAAETAQLKELFVTLKIKSLQEEPRP